MQTRTCHTTAATHRSASLAFPIHRLERRRTVPALGVLLLALFSVSPAVAHAQSRSVGEQALMAKFDAVPGGAVAERGASGPAPASDARFPTPEQALLGRSSVENVSGVRAADVDHGPAIASQQYPTP